MLWKLGRWNSKRGEDTTLLAAQFCNPGIRSTNDSVPATAQHLELAPDAGEVIVWLGNVSLERTVWSFASKH
jgi:hypothetical protein